MSGYGASTRSDDPNLGGRPISIGPTGDPGVQPPVPQWWRRRIVAVWVIIALNIVVFAAWHLSVYDSTLRNWMAANFLTSALHLQDGRPWTLLTSEFSHIAVWHILLNMIVLYSFGAVLERMWGWRLFTAFYLICAVGASVAHCVVSPLVIGRNDVYALGASGALAGLLAAYALQFPRHRILIFGIVPVPALAGALAFVALDVWGLVAQGRGGGLPIGHGAHLGGAACGALLWVLLYRRRFPQVGTPARTRAGGLPMPRLDRTESAELRRLHDKIGRHGPGSLTAEETEFLRRLRQRVFRGESGQ